MNFTELQQKIYEIGVDSLAGEDYDETLLPAFEIVHEEGDCEGGGDHSEKVYHFKDDDIYVQITGFYASYNGTDWNCDLEDIKQVTPKQKTITVYE